MKNKFNNTKGTVIIITILNIVWTMICIFTNIDLECFTVSESIAFTFENQEIIHSMLTLLTISIIIISFVFTSDLCKSEKK